MKINPLKIYLSIIVLLLSTQISAQQFPDLLNKLDTGYRQEKLYLQFDRSMYNPGEKIWFKAYLFAGNFPSLISKTLYTELTDVKGRLLQRIISPVILSSTAGSLDIPADVSGTVFIRSYTKWMLNFDSSFLYTKAISILAPQKQTGKISATQSSKANSVSKTSSLLVHFFPEGGDLVQDVESRVAFKASNQKGMPVNITGEVLDKNGNKITSFTSVHDGMGIFILQPENGEQYKAVWKDDLGESHEAFLPVAKQKGIVLEAGYLGSQIEFKIKRSSKAPEHSFVYVMAQMNQQLLYKAKVYVDKTQIAKGIIPTENSPAGIVQITVLSADEQPLAERIIFANLIDYSFITELNATITDTGKRKKNIIRIDVPDTIPCNLSIAVTDADINPGLPDDNIYSRLLLTGDIKGYVHDPAYYFTHDADSVANHLELVMMTNGWRRFKWEDLLAGHFPEIKYLPENYISIDGLVHGLNKTLLAEKEINGILELKDKRRVLLNIPVQPDGKFNFEGMVFYDTAKLFYQFNKDKKRTLTSRGSFDIKSNLLQNNLRLQPDNYLFPVLNQSDTVSLTKIKDVFQEQSNDLELHQIKTLKTVEVTTKMKTRQELMDKEYTSGLFSDAPGGNSRIVLPEEDPAFLASPNLFSYLQGRIAGLLINVDGNDASVTWRGFQTSLFVNEISQTSLSFETGKLMEDPSYIMSLPMSEIAMVKIFNPPFFGAGSSSSGGEGGAISVYLKKGNERTQMIKGLEYITVPGYSPIREFYSPDYSMPDRSDIPDYRTTLYWNPFIVTDKGHRQITVTFYNNDFTKKMKVIIEGCNEEGKLTRVEKILQ